MRKLILSVILFLVLLCSASYASYEYTETANSYSCSGNWYNCQDTYDGDWNSFGFANVYGENASVYINYSDHDLRYLTKPSLWQVKHYDSGWVITNISLPESCETENVLRLKMTSVYGPSMITKRYCWNGTDYYELLTTGSPDVYEEGIWMNMPKIIMEDTIISREIWHYQEIANQFGYNGTMTNINYANDSNWNTYAVFGGLPTPGNIFENYSKPNYAELGSVLKYVTYFTPNYTWGIYNWTINESCFNLEPIQFKANSNGNFCWNGSSWYQFKSISGSYFYETGIWWYDSEVNLTINKSINLDNLVVESDIITMSKLGFNNSEPFYNTSNLNSSIQESLIIDSNFTNNLYSSDFLHYFRFYDLDTSSFDNSYIYGIYPNNNGDYVVIFFTNFNDSTSYSWLYNSSTLNYTEQNFGFDVNYTTHNNITFYINRLFNGSLEGFNRSISIELGSLVNVTTYYAGNSTICLDFDHYDYGTNFICGNYSVSTIINITHFRKDYFSNNSGNYTIMNLSFTNTQNISVNLSSHQYDKPLNLSFNISGYDTGSGYPTNVKIYLNETMIANHYMITDSTNVTRTTFRNSTILNITFPEQRLNLTGYIYLPKSAIVYNATFNVTGSYTLI